MPLGACLNTGSKPRGCYSGARGIEWVEQRADVEIMHFGEERLDSRLVPDIMQQHELHLTRNAPSGSYSSASAVRAAWEAGGGRAAVLTRVEVMYALTVQSLNLAMRHRLLSRQKTDRRAHVGYKHRLSGRSTGQQPCSRPGGSTRILLPAAQDGVTRLP